MPGHGPGLGACPAHAARPRHPRWLEIGRSLVTRPASIAAAVLVLASAPAPGDVRQAQAERPEGFPDISRPGTGALCLRDPDLGPVTPFPLTHTEVEARVSGQVAQVTVEQRFQNPFDRPIEAVYIFPLPHEAAVNDFEMQIGERLIRGEIHERSAAQEIYARARDRGQVAALLDQERPNVFTQSIANIVPGNEIVIRLRYVESLEYDERGYAFVFPTVVGPRYIPGRSLTRDVLPASSGSREEGTGWSPDTDRVPDASRITPPVLPPGQRSGHDIGITVQIDAGVELGKVRCESHAVDLERRGRKAARIALRSSDTIPNKDFVLRWDVAGGSVQFGVLTYRDPDRAPEGTFALHFQPQKEWGADAARPKEMIFLLDTSGSMHGEPMAKVKSAVRWALQNLNGDDVFQIIRFSDRASSFAPAPLPGTAKNVSRALEYLEGLRGGGGTEMRAGIEAALRTPATAERLRLVFFMTDGYIGNENEILATIRRNLGEARLFAFGVGSSVNRFLLDRIADEGRGVVDYVLLHENTRDVVERFYGRVAKPYLTDIELEWEGLEVQDLQPSRLPDLFAAQPLVLMGRYTKPGRGTLIVRGLLGRERFIRRIPVTLPARAVDDEPLAVLWARQRIASASSRRRDGERQALEREITALALQYRLVSAYTSFVAVDNQVMNEAGEPVLVAQPVPMPEGVQYEHVFGEDEEVYRRPRSLKGMSLGGLSRCEPVPLPPGRSGATGGTRMADRGASDAATPVQLRRVGDSGIGESSGVELQARAQSPTFPVGDPIEIRITLHNRSSKDLQVPAKLDLHAGTLWVMVNGRPLVSAETKPGRMAMQTIAAGASHTWTVRLDSAHFVSAGSYKLVLLITQKDLASHFMFCEIEVR